MIAVLWTATVGGAAFAEEVLPPVAASIGVADVELIMTESQAGKAVHSEAGRWEDRFRRQSSAEEAALQAAKQELDHQPAAKSPQALAEKSRAFEQGFTDFQNKTAARRLALEKSTAAAVAKVRQGMAEATQKVAAARGVTLVLPVSEIVYADDKLNLTKEILAAMNASLSRVVFPPPDVDAELAPPAGRSEQTRRKKEP